MQISALLVHARTFSLVMRIVTAQETKGGTNHDWGYRGNAKDGKGISEERTSCGVQNERCDFFPREGVTRSYFIRI